MKLSNGVKVYCKSMGKVFRVAHIARDTAEANSFCEKHTDCSVIAEDGNGLIYIAETYGLTVKSELLPD